MNKRIIDEISRDLNISNKSVQVVLKLLEDGNTIPFIARYRKEATGGLDEKIIQKIEEVFRYQMNLEKRKEDVIRLIDEKKLLTDDLKERLLACQKLVEVEDLYRPYKEKKKTKASEAIARGLEPLAKKIMAQPETGTLEALAAPYIQNQVKDLQEAVEGAKYIIAEWISDNASYRKALRGKIYKEGIMVTKKKSHGIDEEKTYEMYYDYQEPIRTIKPHRVLAINRGEKEGILSVSIAVDHETRMKELQEKIIKRPSSFVKEVIVDAIEDSYKRLIFPSIEREIRSDLKERATDVAIDNFSRNVEKLLLTPPIKGKVVMGLDPGFRTGCKLAVLDPTGNVLDIAVIYPTEPRRDLPGSEKKVLELIDQYQVDIIAIGNGTASRESEQFIASTIKKAHRSIEYIIVSEAGASVYSASPLAQQEFPDLTVEKRSAISIGRRLQDALSELVKIDPKSIGVGLYQHDVPLKQLDESLDYVVTNVVNQVGVNLNTASPSLLSYVSGLTKKATEAILEARRRLGKFTSREELKALKGLSSKQYEQSIGFLRIVGGTNAFDQTDIHPESYPVAMRLLETLHFSQTDIGTEKLKEALSKLDPKTYSDLLNTDHYTLEDIITSLMKPGRDPRDEMPRPLLRSDVLSLSDLKVGDQLQGTVRNVVDFGCFIDVGLHDDGLAHISKLSEHYIKHPLDVVSVGDIVDCYVIGIDPVTHKLSLSLLPQER